MGRAAVALGVRELAERAGLSPDTIARFERWEGLKERTVEAIRAALEREGLEFIDADESFGGEGVRFAYAYNMDHAPPAATEMRPLSVVASTSQAVTVRTSDGLLPVEIEIDAVLINSLTGIAFNEEKRREILRRL